MTARLLISPRLLRLFVLTQGRRKPHVSICNLTVLTHLPRPRAKWLNEKGEEVGLKLTSAPEYLITEIWIKERKGVGERKKTRRRMCRNLSFISPMQVGAHTCTHHSLIMQQAQCAIHTDRSILVTYSIVKHPHTRLDFCTDMLL